MKKEIENEQILTKSEISRIKMINFLRTVKKLTNNKFVNANDIFRGYYIKGKPTNLAGTFEISKTYDVKVLLDYGILIAENMNVKFKNLKVKWATSEPIDDKMAKELSLFYYNKLNEAKRLKAIIESSTMFIDFNESNDEKNNESNDENKLNTNLTTVEHQMLALDEINPVTLEMIHLELLKLHSKINALLSINSNIL